MSERRKELRIPVLKPLQAIDDASGESIGTLANISYSGLLLLCQQCIEPNRVLQLKVPIPDSLISGAPELILGVESVWAEADGSGKNHWCGFQIIDYAPQATQILARLINEFS